MHIDCNYYFEARYLYITLYYIIQMTNQKVEKDSFTKFLDTIQPFWIGGFSGMFATCVIQPLDMIKVTIQLKSEKG